MASRSRKRTLAMERMDECQIKRRRCDVNNIRFPPSRFQNEPSTRAAKGNFQLIPYPETPLPQMSTDEIANNLCNEIGRLCKQKQLHITEAAVSHKQDMKLNDNEFGTQMLGCSDEMPLFTFKQVQLICKDLIKERESQLQQCYESMLTTKLIQQYDVFVKFTYDQIQRRFEAAPSYLS